MARYIGIDVHLKSCTVAIMDHLGRRIRQDVLETDAQTLQRYLQRIPGTRHVCFEEGTQSEWLHELLEPHCDELVVVQPEARQDSKSDVRDAWELADALRRNALGRVVYKAPGRFTQLRNAVRTYDQVVRDHVRCKNRLKGVWAARGIHCEGNELYCPDMRKPLLALLRSPYRRRAEILAEEHDHLTKVVADTQGWLLVLARRTPDVALLATAPGIGPIRAAQIVATIVTPHRFGNHRQFRQYCGLGIVKHSSSDWEKDHQGRWRQRRNVSRYRGLNPDCNHRMKNVFKGAAKTVTGMKEGKLAEEYRELLANGAKPNLARLTIARRIACIVLAMWKDGSEYDPSRHTSMHE